ncbi:MAG TPA: hypothetical protein VI306_21865 [Pyrinomonadaceae bacterium]
MAEPRNSETLAKQFLLGKLAPELVDSFEESLFTDDAVFEEVEISEDDLVEAYVSDELSPEERKQFERTLLRSPRLAQRIQVTKRLLMKASPPPVHIQKQTMSWWARLKAMLLPPAGSGRLAFAATALVLLVGSSILFMDWLRLRETSKTWQSERTALEKRNEELLAEQNRTSVEQDRLRKDVEAVRAENSKLTEQLEREAERPSLSTILLALTLGPGISRAPAESHTLNLPATPARIQFNLLLGSDAYVSYKAVVTTIGGREISQQSNLKSHTKGANKIVSIVLSSTRFTPGDYLVTLSGVTKSGQVDQVDDYQFRVRTASTPR